VINAGFSCGMTNPTAAPILRLAQALIHRQLPFSSNFITAQNVDVAVAAHDFNVAIVGATSGHR
jgi:hypothetical protein